MATIRQRGQSWQVQVRRDGHIPLSKSFRKHSLAVAWARQVESELDRGVLLFDSAKLRSTTLRDVLERYRDKVSPGKRGAEQELHRLKQFLSIPLADLSLAKLTPELIAAHRDRRLEQVSPGTVRRELALLHHALEKARIDWGMPLLANPVSRIRLPEQGQPRQRRVSPAEIESLISPISNRRAGPIRDIVRFAIETGMRRGEIVRLRWTDVDLEQHILHIPRTKNGHPRTIPLTDGAARVLMARAGVSGQSDGSVFGVSAMALRLAWERLKLRAKVEDLHFHDLRHEAISRFFERGLSVAEVALISGHRDVRMLFRYTHLRAEDIAKKFI